MRDRPKAQSWLVIEPSGSEEAEASKLTVSGASPVVGSAAKLAVGA